MLLKVIDYTLKIWLTSILVAPVAFILILLIKDHSTKGDFLEMFFMGLVFYGALVILHALFSIITMLVFVVVVRVVLYVPVVGVVKTIMICIAGIVLTAITFFVTILHNSTLVECSNNGFLILMICNCACIGFGVWYYKLENYSNNTVN